MLYEVINISETASAVAQKTTEAAAKGGEALGQVTFDPFLIGSKGIVISIIGYGIVFIALILLFYMISLMSKLIRLNIRKRLEASGKAKHIDFDKVLTGEVNAAIAMALYLHFQEAHDIESTVLTIEKVQKRYSPWNSKIQGMRTTPIKR
ncbi:MAG: hypothetical protein CSA81_10250 [Acidobacteria bacterium]|nr:MAG: hypothetical protein CSA81_10250 [Acidobacteriota bacterium]PIE91384.1 MAG: hypothetical protein CR997_01300 [Acidobacteriota bacterium]